ncbi:MAG: BLUF domain-containing protein [Bacteroidota bacterium]
MSIFQLVYLSQTIDLLSGSELDTILETSHFNNKGRNITGVLLYVDGNVIQLLEGDEYEVQRLYRKICQDHRHYGMIVLYQGFAETRLFPDWSMGYHRVSRFELEDQFGSHLDLDEESSPDFSRY